MTERSLQITYRKGRPFAGYLHLPHTADAERNRSVATSNGVLVVDYNTADEPIRIEITAPQNVSAELLNDVLSSLGQPALVDNELAPLATGQDDVLVHELKSLAPDVVALLDERDAASRLLEALPTKYPTSQMGQVNPTRAWELTALGSSRGEGCTKPSACSGAFTSTWCLRRTSSAFTRVCLWSG